MNNEPCKVDLTKTDTYPDGQVPDGDVEICMKVIRTVKDIFAINGEKTRADALEKAHAIIHYAVVQCE